MTSIIAPRYELPIADDKGRISREWYKYLVNLGQSSGGSSTATDDTSILGVMSDLEDIQPPDTVLASDYAIDEPPASSDDALLAFMDDLELQPQILQEAGAFTATQTGGTTAPTGTAVYARVQNIVVVTIQGFSNMTSNSTALTITGMPATLAPVNRQGLSVPAFHVADAGSLVNTVSAIVTAGSSTITFLKNGGAAGFTNSATNKGLQQAWTFMMQLN